ncbi:MAG: hypothetical protein JSW20_04830 [Nitrospiraceae bacterium]|nr:MAG: hypothetical protein JSW20_04830 [Nitrospiraceae bacterium]
MRLVTDSGYIQEYHSVSLLNDFDELLKIISAIQRKMKSCDL